MVVVVAGDDGGSAVDRKWTAGRWIEQRPFGAAGADCNLTMLREIATTQLWNLVDWFEFW